MRTPKLITCLSAALCVALLAAGCSTKGVQVTAEDEMMQGGQADGSVGAAGTGRGLGRSGMSEEDLASDFGGRGSGQIGESDLGSGGFGGGPGGGLDPSMESEGELGGLGSFPEMGGTGSSGFSDQGFGGFESIERGQMPSEDRVGEGSMIAKVDPSDTFESQMEGMLDDRVSEAAGQLEDVFFGYDSWSISEDAKMSLGESAEWLKSNPAASLTIEGHCDERGSSSYNLVLGEKRAKAVRNYLVELGVSPARVKVVSYEIGRAHV